VGPDDEHGPLVAAGESRATSIGAIAVVCALEIAAGAARGALK